MTLPTLQTTYILDAKGNPIPEPDVLKWGAWFTKADRRVALTELSNNIYISTVFLGLDHSFLFTGPPILYETMIFWEGHDLHNDEMRYATREQALIGHEIMVKRVRKAIKS